MYIARYDSRFDTFTIKWWKHPTPTAAEFKEYHLTGHLIGRPQWLLSALDASKLAGTMYDHGEDEDRWVAWMLLNDDMVISQCLRMEDGFSVDQMEFPDM